MPPDWLIVDELSVETQARVELRRGRDAPGVAQFARCDQQFEEMALVTFAVTCHETCHSGSTSGLGFHDGEERWAGRRPMSVKFRGFRMPRRANRKHGEDEGAEG